MVTLSDGGEELLTVNLVTQARPHPSHFFFFFITLGLELSDTKVYEP
jgi:hypothetical protein